MRIFVTGTRGIPDIPGGVEKHCQELYPLIAAAGHQVLLATRIPYIKKESNTWQGVELVHLYAPQSKSLEAIVHTFLAVLEAKRRQADLIHIHAVGPGLLAPFARLLGLKVVVTNHGPDYDRQKWGPLAKTVLRLGEYLGGKFANQVIVISSVIAEIIRNRCGRESNLIYNGVPLPDRSESKNYLEQTGIKPKNYILAVARFVPEKGLHDLINAFADLKGNYQLVIAGDADHETTYSRKLKELAAEDERIILTGYITGEDLNQVFSHARLFCLPSYHEGLPIALLEAMSYGLPLLVSDIPANKEVELPGNRFFKCGDIEDLKSKLGTLLEKKFSLAEQQKVTAQIKELYNWAKIAKQTISAYEKAVKRS